mmetsp:Transcript_56320/g.156901  ORF Transcript_56320/g.156901 Transcript_56320/m.156901 type:complete len:249 (+) Transcript_56320:290-1036(+)
MAVKLLSAPFLNAVRTMFLEAASGSSQCSLAKSTTSWLLSVLKMLAVAMTTKRSLSIGVNTFTSGSGIKSAAACLKAKSPNDRVMDTPWYSRRDALLLAFGFAGAAIRQDPRTFSTRPPARSTLFFSSMRCGRWSSVNATASPPRQRTARVSPTWARTSRKAEPSFGFPWSNANKAVEPLCPNFFRSARPRISLSVWTNASLIANFSFSSRDAGCTCFCRNCAKTFLWSCFEASSDTCAPLWPSKAAK